ncbi:hypothetical protein CH278_11935 [Rhodococcus sp. 05-2254-5]|nr:hypothetical protein VF34_00876 [Rhodococcus sp. PML026]MDP9639867.1 hypothetical protein [Rhodococcus cercidiphylli]NIL92225.1 hypothetical protein [Rhodococcus fascians]OZE33964.1 hypothetical protein CH278_11935 [Rhodococcus sp. 05-2254-5]OZE63567.1 hypothetical protein CH269_02495 [Rhodococcus sp. 05-2254-1]
MYYEHVLSEHRQRVARGVENYERRRVAAERAAESVAAQERIEPVQESVGKTTGNDEGTPGNGDSSESGIGSGFVSVNR